MDYTTLLLLKIETIYPRDSTIYTTLRHLLFVLVRVYLKVRQNMKVGGESVSDRHLAFLVLTGEKFVGKQMPLR